MRKHYERLAAWHGENRHRVRHFVWWSLVCMLAGAGAGVSVGLLVNKIWTAPVAKFHSQNMKAPPARVVTYPSEVKFPDSYLLVANKKHPMPRNFVPNDLVDLPLPQMERAQLRRVPAAALQKLFKDAQADGLQLTVASAYRSYAAQEATFKQVTKSQGASVALDASALPGYSEHQSGLAADIDPIQPTTVPTLQSWLAKNACRHGFIVRYLPGKTAITGYQSEPWHIRYVGDVMAEFLTRNGETLEEFYNVAGGDYAS